MDEKLLLQRIKSRPTKTYLRSDKSKKSSLEIKVKIKSDLDLPEEFNGKEIWKDYLSPVKDQGSCGSCWAFASVSTLSDRFSLHSLGKLKPDLSTSKLILCDFNGKEFDIDHPEKEQQDLAVLDASNLSSNSCHGNSLEDAWRYLYDIGTVDESCAPYSIIADNDGDKLKPFCFDIAGPIGDMCIDRQGDSLSGEEYGTPARFYRCYHFYRVPGTSEDNGDESYIRKEIYVRGPVSTGMKVFKDFYSFDPKKDVYEWNNQGESIGGHAITIVGWGNGVQGEYWWVKNSWGEKWGIDGYFKMRRGKNTCSIEENVIVGLPDFFYPFGTDIPYTEDDEVENKEAISRRTSIATDITITGGGIDSETGYTRRTIVNKPWINLSRPIPLDSLPDWNDFIAGKLTSKKSGNRVILYLVLFSIFLLLLLFLKRRIRR